MRLNKYLILLTLIGWACDDEVQEDPPTAGEVAGSVAGSVAGDVAGSVAGDVAGSVAGSVAGDEAGSVAGEVPAGQLMSTQCSDGVDNDEDGTIDLEDRGCADEDDDDESDDPPVTCYEREVIDLNAALDANGYFEGDLSEFGMNQTQGSCGGNAGPEAIFSFRVRTPLTRLVFTTEFAETLNPTVIYVRDSCEGTAGIAGNDLTCNRGASATPGTTVELLEVLPSTYYIFVDTSSMMTGPGAFRLEVIADGAPQCRDEVDNDGDGLVDLLDPGCEFGDDLDETDPDPLPECGDGIDNDGDQLIDYPNDPDCAAAGENREAQLCQNDYTSVYQVDQAGAAFLVAFDEGETESFSDGCRANSGPEAVIILNLDEPSRINVDFEDSAADFSVYLRSTCDDVTSQIECVNDMTRSLRATDLQPGEYFLFIDSHVPDIALTPDLFPFIDITITSLITECNDEIDNDNDGLIDFADLGCVNGSDDSEVDPAITPICSDGIDNDGDNLTDYPEDPDCVAAGSRYETAGCLNIDPVGTVGINGGTVFVDTSLGEDNYAGSCGSSTSTAPEQMIELELTQPATVTITLENGTFDSILYLRSDCELEEASSFCDDFGIAEELLYFPRLEKGRYFVFVDGYFSTSSGPVDVVFEINPIPQQACEDEEDNDQDGLVDIADPGCANFYDDDETDEAITPECADENDNDGDGLIDYPEDPGCFARGGVTEAPLCGIPNPVYQLGQAGGSVDHVFGNGGSVLNASCLLGEGVEAVIELTIDELSDVSLSVRTGVDFTTRANSIVSVWDSCGPSAQEQGCLPSSDASLPLVEAGVYYIVVERQSGIEAIEQPWRINVEVNSRIGECNDEIDNDSDGLIDLFDSGCQQRFDQSELDPDVIPQCFDQIDNDGDGQTDYPDDVDCVAAGDNVEQRRCDVLEAIEVNSEGISYLFDPTTGEDTTLPTCSSFSGPEAVFAVSIDEPSSIIVNSRYSTGEYADVITSIRRRCDDLNSEIDCVEGFPLGRRTFSNIQRGVYFVFVETVFSSDIDPINIEISVLSNIRACSDNVDNDGDNLIDLLDDGCSSFADDDETSPDVSPACSDAVDNDGDGVIDYPADDFCLAAGQALEAPFCAAFNGEMGSAPGAEIIVVSETSTLIDIDTSVEEASQAYQSGTSAESPEIPVAVLITQPSYVMIEAMTGSYDTFFHMRASDCDDPSAQIAFDDDGGEDRLSRLEFDVLDPGVYYLFVDGFGGSNSGTSTVFIEISPINAVSSACGDNIDNDEDLLTDLMDPGCVTLGDNDETDPDVIPACAAGTDDDGDGLFGYPDDPDCLSAGDQTDATYCAQLPSIFATLDAGVGRVMANPPVVGEYVTTGTCGAAIGQPEAIIFDVDELSDVYITLDAAGSDTSGSAAVRTLSIRSDCDNEFAETSCVRLVAPNTRVLVGELLPAGQYTLFVERRLASDDSEITVDFEIVSRVTECNDEIDNNDNGLVDLYDYGCVTGDSPSESIDPNAPIPECADQVDNDEDNLIDYPEDPDCTGAGYITEASLCDIYDPVIVMGSGLRYRYEPTEIELVTNSCGSTFLGTSGEAIFAIYLEATSTVGVVVTDDDGDYSNVYRELRDFCDDTAEVISCFDTIDDDVMAVTGVEAGWHFLSVHRSYFNSDPFTVEIFLVPEVAPVYACSDEVDNDDDGFVDLDDPGCYSSTDDDETDPDVPPTCMDTIDNDGDLLTDYPADPDCLSAGDMTEATRCVELDSMDVDVPFADEPALVTVSPNGFGLHEDVGSCEAEEGRGDASILSFEVTELSDLYVSLRGSSFERIVYLRKACEDDPEDETDEVSCRFQSVIGERAERLLAPGRYYLHVKRTEALDIEPFSVGLRLVSRVTQCNDGEDNDADGLIDLFDSGCFNGDDTSEYTDPDAPLPACADFEDNDGDMLIDYPEDPDCQSAGANYETAGCLNIQPSAYIGFGQTSIELDTTSATHNYAGACGSSFTPSTSGESMVQLELDFPAYVRISVSSASSGYDTIIYLRSDCEALEPVNSCDDTGIANEVLEFNRLEAGRYFVFLDGYLSNDVGTATLNFNVVSLITECNDGEDNDEDGFIDAEDLGCEGEADQTENSESEPDFVVPECGDQIDNDEDGFTDYPDDPDCLALGGVSEIPICTQFNFEDAGVGGDFYFEPTIDYVGQGVECASTSGEEAVYRINVEELSRVTVDVTEESGSASSVYVSLRSSCDDGETELDCFTTYPSGPRIFNEVEAGYYFVFVHRSSAATENPFNVNIQIDSLIVECNDTDDNDEDGLIDDEDPGCSSSFDDSEATDSEPEFVIPECSDEVDNDGDMLIDFPDDPECVRAGDNTEAISCNLYDGDIITISETTATPFVIDTSSSQNNYEREGTFGPVATGPEVPFMIELDVPSDVSITYSSSLDTYLHIRSGVCDDPAAEIGFNDDGGENFNSAISLTALPAGVYFVFVDGYNADDFGPISVSVIITPSP